MTHSADKKIAPPSGAACDEAAASRSQCPPPDARAAGRGEAAPDPRTERSETPPLDDLIERAFRFRGDVTLTTADGAEIVGYLYNRDGASVHLFESATGRDFSIPYAALADIRLTGRDTASGKHFESFQRRRAGQ